MKKLIVYFSVLMLFFASYSVEAKPSPCKSKIKKAKREIHAKERVKSTPYYARLHKRQSPRK